MLSPPPFDDLWVSHARPPAQLPRNVRAPPRQIRCVRSAGGDHDSSDDDECVTLISTFGSRCRVGDASPRGRSCERDGGHGATASLSRRSSLCAQARRPTRRRARRWATRRGSAAGARRRHPRRCESTGKPGKKSLSLLPRAQESDVYHLSGESPSVLRYTTTATHPGHHADREGVASCVQRSHPLIARLCALPRGGPGRRHGGALACGARVVLHLHLPRPRARLRGGSSARGHALGGLHGAAVQPRAHRDGPDPGLRPRRPAATPRGPAQAKSRRRACHPHRPARGRGGHFDEEAARRFAAEADTVLMLLSCMSVETLERTAGLNTVRLLRPLVRSITKNADRARRCVRAPTPCLCARARSRRLCQPWPLLSPRPCAPCWRSRTWAAARRRRRARASACRTCCSSTLRLARTPRRGGPARAL
mmetsp:Transcript_1701/g.6246  ORF Transcript_1701/g.6246 Transcript_1701/m.6246 type:complete len:423 (-) Transcript_1701:1465-2733(-)